MAIKRRAITGAQKEDRRLAILQSAEQLFKKFSFKEISMAQIATAAGVAKGTVFLYFGTKEELFLALTWQEYQRCFSELNKGLSRYLEAAIPCSIDDFIAIVRLALTENQTLLRLIAINSVILEQNIQQLAAFHFKMMLVQQMTHTSELIEKAMPFLSPGESKMILLQLQMLAVGAQHLAEPAPIVKQVIQDESLQMFNIEFDSIFFDTLKAILIGLQSRGKSE